MDEQTLVDTYRETIGPLYGYVSRRCGDRSLAEDIVQESWLRALDAWVKKGPPERPLAWLKTVARNLLSNHYRRMPLLSLDRLPEGVGAEVLVNGDGWDRPDHAAVVGWGLARLRPGSARVLEAFHLEGLSVAEIAREMGISERSVEGRLRRARVKLRKQLERVVGD